MIIGKSVSSSQESFPRAHTCFFKLELPPYETDEILKKKLMFAICNTASMNLDEVAEVLIKLIYGIKTMIYCETGPSCPVEKFFPEAVK